MNVGERLQALRKAKNISIYKLSQDSNVSENHIRNLERGTKQPTIATLEQLTCCLNITLSEFFNIGDIDVLYPTKNEKEFIDYYRTLSKEKADALLSFCKIIGK